MADIDSKIDEEIGQFVATYLTLGREASPAMHRRLLGVYLLSDQALSKSRPGGRNGSDPRGKEAKRAILVTSGRRGVGST
jgi:hypothetical protein